MTPISTEGMEPHTKKRFQFALSAFTRMYGQSIIHNHDIKQFCLDWSLLEVNAPLRGLDEVDQYMYYEYKNWRGR